MERLSSARCFGGEQLQLCHDAESTRCPMTLSVYLPPQAADGPVPAVWFLSGLTCTDQNFVTKAGAQRYAAELGIALVAPDTSPRGPDVPGDPDGAWDFGHGAGFYVDATQAPWDRHYRMYSYVTAELPALLARELPLDPDRVSITGHSMGGHGALVAALRNPGRYRSVGAFSPISAPSQVPWGHKALGRYLGPERGAWREWDATALVEDGARPGCRIRVDQGLADGFLDSQLRPDLLEDACSRSALEAEIVRHAGYDHSYWFVSSFIGEQLRWHSAALRS